MKIEENTPVGLLKRHGLSKTASRLKVLSILRSREVATPQPYLEKELGKEVDRVTIYRTLNVFEEKGIIHKILDQNGTANYAICSEECNEHKHYDHHFHFNCTLCNNVYCMKEIVFPNLEIPLGFKAEEVHLTVMGVCRDCSEKST